MKTQLHVLAMFKLTSDCTVKGFYSSSVLPSINTVKQAEVWFVLRKGGHLGVVQLMCIVLSLINWIYLYTAV
jgi:hypothetical protein